MTPVGLFDLDRKIRPVGKVYKKLIQDWQKVLPTQSVCLRVPVDLPSEQEEKHAAKFRLELRRRKPTQSTEPDGSDEY